MTHTAWHGELVTLRDVEPDDWEAFYGFDQETEVARMGWEINFPGSKERLKEWALEKAKKRADDDNHFFAIVAPDGRVAGSINTHGCDRRNGTFEYGIALGSSFQGQRLGPDAMCVMFRHYFDELGYHRVWAEVYAFNERSIALHEQFGFVLEGRLREALYSGGRRHDVLLYGMTAAEFRARHPSHRASE